MAKVSLPGVCSVVGCPFPQDASQTSRGSRPSGEGDQDHYVVRMGSDFLCQELARAGSELFDTIGSTLVVAN